jgi:hypothetical protein
MEFSEAVSGRTENTYKRKKDNNTNSGPQQKIQKN